MVLEFPMSPSTAWYLIVPWQLSMERLSDSLWRLLPMPPLPPPPNISLMLFMLRWLAMSVSESKTIMASGLLLLSVLPALLPLLPFQLRSWRYLWRNLSGSGRSKLLPAYSKITRLNMI